MVEEEKSKGYKYDAEVPMLPDYLELQQSGNFIVHTREGEFEIRELTGEEYDSVERIAGKVPNITDFRKAIMMVARALVKPAMSEQELLGKYKLSTLQRLAVGISYYVDESKAFLLTTASESKETTGNISSSKSASAFIKRLTS